MPFPSLGGFFYRNMTRDRAAEALAQALWPEGRFHHYSQPTLYVSSRPDWACHAIAANIRPEDPTRVILELNLSSARVLDLRDPAHCATFGIDPSLAAVSWLPERAQGKPASPSSGGRSLP